MPSHLIFPSAFYGKSNNPYCRSLIVKKSRAASARPRYRNSKLKTFGADNLSHALLHTTSSIVVGLDSEANIVLFNSGAEKATGWKSKDALGRNWIKTFIFEPERKRIKKAFDSTVLREGHMSHYENRILTKGGRHLHVHWNNTVITADGGFLMTLSIGDDVTALRHTEAKLKNQNRKLRELSKMQEQFMADITHELKTPLSVILLNLDLVRHSCPGATCRVKRKPLDLMWRNAIRLSRSIEGIMQLTKLDSVDMQASKFSLMDVLTWVVDDYRPLAESKRLKLLMHGRDIMVKGDPHILAMAMSNLISNAIKFTEKGLVRISWAENNGDVVITVSDTGRGILKMNQKKIFSKYFKEDHDSPGSGIGLTVSYGLVRKMGGKMDFKSVPGKGSTFTIKVPKEVKNEKNSYNRRRAGHS